MEMFFLMTSWLAAGPGCLAGVVALSAPLEALERYADIIRCMPDEFASCGITSRYAGENHLIKNFSVLLEEQ